MADDKKFTKDDIDKAVADAVSKIEASVEKLEAKNEELVGEVRKYKTEARKAKDIAPEDLQAAEERADKAEAEVAKLTGDLKKAGTDLEKATKALEAESGFTQKLLIQDGLKSALIANGVKDEDFIDTLTAKFGSTAKVEIDGDNRVAKIGDKAVGDFVKEWAGTDSGKKFVGAPVNSGGGAGGSGGAGGGKTATSEQFDSMKPKERAAFMAEGGQVADA